MEDVTGSFAAEVFEEDSKGKSDESERDKADLPVPVAPMIQMRGCVGAAPGVFVEAGGPTEGEFAVAITRHKRLMLRVERDLDVSCHRGNIGIVAEDGAC